MIIDCTRKPLLILPDEVQDSVVVRSIGDRGVSGLVTFTSQRRKKNEAVALEPEARLTRGSSTCFETRLILPGAKRGPTKESPYEQPLSRVMYVPGRFIPGRLTPDPYDDLLSEGRAAPVLYALDASGHRVAIPAAYAPRDTHETPREQAAFTPDPYEVVSTYKDPVTKFSGSWRLGVLVERHPKGKLWLVTVSDATTSVLLVTLAVKGLDPNPLMPEPLPLNRATRNVAVGTAWDRILGDD
jgi:hypothetical protein